jgi:glycosyltransferase involved in cell wall biosynthesis
LQREIVPLVIYEAAITSRPRDPERPVGSPPRLLCVSRAVPHKRLEEVIAVHACLQRTCNPDVQLDLVGDTSLCPDYVAWLKTLGDAGAISSPHWHGKVSSEALDTLHREADVLICLSAHEGFGVPLLEAMWHGIPIVAAACEGVEETLGHAGLIIRERHIAAIAEMIDLTLMNPSLRRSVIEAGHDRARHFARSTLEPRFREAWRRLLS